jgi:inorganic pyrophosphatase
MQKHWDQLQEDTRGPFTVIVDKTWEDLHPGDLFDDSVTDIKEICRKIDGGQLDWFVLRARVFFEGVELSSDIVGGFLYEDAGEVLTDGVAEDLIDQAMESAVKEALRMEGLFDTLVLPSI